MKKNIAKTLLTLCFALSVFMCGSSMASAAVSYPDATNHTHNFVRTHVGTVTEDGGTHQYVWGRINGEPIYRFDCHLTNIVWIYTYKCEYCQETTGSSERQTVTVTHSISHE